MPQIERGELATTEAVARSFEALGRQLDPLAGFGDHTLTVATNLLSAPTSRRFASRLQDLPGMDRFSRPQLQAAGVRWRELWAASGRSRNGRTLEVSPNGA